MEILHGKWVGIFPMMKNGWGDVWSYGKKYRRS